MGLFDNYLPTIGYKLTTKSTSPASLLEERENVTFWQYALPLGSIRAGIRFVQYILNI
jgi:hypothetical protein